MVLDDSRTLSFAEPFHIDRSSQFHRIPLVSSRAQREIFPIPSRVGEGRFLTSFEMTHCENFTIFIIVIVCVSWLQHKPHVRRRKTRKAPRRLPCRGAGLDAFLDHGGKKNLAKIRPRGGTDPGERRSARGAGVDRPERSVSLRLGHGRDHRAAPGYPGRPPRRHDEHPRLVIAHSTQRPVRTGFERQDPRHLARARCQLYSSSEAVAR